MTDKRKTNKCGQTQSHDLIIKGHTRNRKCIPLRGGSGSDGPDVQIQERSSMSVLGLHLSRTVLSKVIFKGIFLQCGEAAVCV